MLQLLKCVQTLTFSIKAVFSSHLLTLKRDNIHLPHSNMLSSDRNMFRYFLLVVASLSLLCSDVEGSRLKITSTVSPPTFQTTETVFVANTNDQKELQGSNDKVDGLRLWTPPPDIGMGGALCQIWNQDCPDGFKCIPEDLTSRPRCRKIVNNPDQVGDSCSTLADKDGDSCDIDGMCIQGVCRQLCTGNAANPTCPDLDDTCHIYEDGATICEAECDPLLGGNSCPGGRYCSIDAFASPNTDLKFSCMFEPDEPLGLEGDSCVLTSQCREGYACVPKTSLKNGFCDNNNALSCCTRLAEDEDDCQAGDQLVPFYPDPPPGYEHIGVCVFVVF